MADSRWNPWIGTWRLVSDTVPAASEEAKKNFLLEISPKEEGRSVFMKAIEGEKALFEDTITADGKPRTLKEDDCTGSYTYTWSNTGERLLFESEMDCPNEAARKISGLSVINRKGEWLDFQLMENKGARIITIRRYEKLDATAAAQDTGTRNPYAFRSLSGSNLSLDEIIELSKKLPSEILEAALMEYRAPYKMNSKSLVRLADADVPGSVIDLMVALSFPDEFVIEQDTISPIAKAETRQQDRNRVYSIPLRVNYSIIDPYFPWYWSPSTYSLYWNYGWSVWPGYYYVYPGGGGPGGTASRRGSGVLVDGQGYTKVRPVNGSFAQPRYAQDRAGSIISGSRTGSRSSGSTYSGATGSYSAGGSGSYAGASSSGGSGSAASSGGGGSSSGSSGGGSGYSGGSSGGGSPSASPSGYSSGGGGGGSAVAR
jgi:hypothetical protein